MRKYFNYIVLVLCMAFSFNTYAASITIDTDNLTKEQIAQITGTVEKVTSEATVAVENVTADKIKKTADAINSIDTEGWAEKGSAIGEAVVNFTSKIGIAAADLLASPTGFMIVVGIILYQVGPTLFFAGLAVLWVVLATKIALRIFSEKDRVVAKEKTSKDGTVTVTYKDTYTLHFHSVRNGESVFGLSAMLIVFNLPALFLLELAAM